MYTTQFADDGFEETESEDDEPEQPIHHDEPERPIHQVDGLDRLASLARGEVMPAGSTYSSVESKEEALWLM